MNDKQYADQHTLLTREEDALADINLLKRKLQDERALRIEAEQACEEYRRGNCAVVGAVSERVRKAGEQRLNIFFAASPAIMAVFDQDLRISKIGRAAEAYFRRPPEQLLGRGLHEFCRNAVPLESALERVRITGLPALSLEISGPHVENVDAAPCWNISAFPIGAEDDDYHIGLIAVDVTKRCKAEQKLQEYSHRLAAANKDLQGANQCLQELSEMKSYFVSMAAHELKTPLVSIIGLAETMRSDDLAFSDEEKRHFLGTIESEGKRLSGLLSQMLDISRIETGRLELHTEHHDLAALIEETVGAMRIPKDVRISMALPAGDKLIARIDRNRMTQVFINLLSNAINYSEAGAEVRIEARRERAAVRLCVRDHGKGIDPADLPRIFDRFYRGKIRGAKSGSGLGLSITRGIIKAHGGDIRVESKPGEGSAFYITIPLEQRTAN